MKKIDLRIDVSTAAGLDGPQQIAASVFLPEPSRLRSPAVAIFAAPGGGYTRRRPAASTTRSCQSRPPCRS